MSLAQSAEQPSLESLDSGTMETLVRQYFELFNRGEFQEVASLFAIDGYLQPPFEEPIVGQAAISTYLHQEADGMKAEPLTIEACALEDGTWQVNAIGKVNAVVFKVNVAWSFVVTAHCELASVRVDLKASLQELLKIRPTGAESMS